ncbi:MAG: ATP-binding protein [Muribaculaceae bacterium]|nr:ATP-binding protein [Muribaculaceae bacterium]
MKYAIRFQSSRVLILLISALAIVIFLLISNNLIKELARQERDRMDIWAQATQRLARTDVDSDFEFLLAIIAQNNNIPVLITDGDFNISEFRNFSLPDKSDRDKSLYGELSERNQRFLTGRLKRPGGDTPLDKMAARNNHFIPMELPGGQVQYIYYEDSKLLRTLTYYPYIQMVVMVILAVILYLAILSTKRAEQNRVWVGLSKETAHQLGTPISSLMAWVEYLQASGAEPEVTCELDKDIRRLSTIADRFSKIGSQPDLELEYINQTIEKSLAYMRTRISSRVKLELRLSPDDHGVMLSESLFEWVMENLTKNAVDAMQGEGRIDITSGCDKSGVWIEVRDSGKGIPRKNFKTVFNPGYTTKKRGWGLGLTLVKRIVEEYHGGKIYVKDSELGRGTTFRLEFPACKV